MKLTTRLITSIIFITTSCLLLFATYQYTSVKTRLYNSLNDQLDKEISFIKHSMIEPLFHYDDRTIDHILQAAMTNPTILSVIVTGYGTTLDTPLYGYFRNVDGSLAKGFTSPLEEEMLKREVDILYNTEHIGKIQITASTTLVKERLHALLTSEFIRIFLLNLVLSTILIAFIRFNIITPILSLTKIAAEFSKGNFSKKIPKGTGDEFEQLGESLNIMRNSIATQIEELETHNTALHESEKNLSTTLNSIGDAVIATNEKGQVVRMNPIAEKLTGWTQEDAIGKLLPEVFVIVNALSGKSCENPVDKVLEQEGVVGLAKDTVLLSKDKTEFYIADSGAPIRDESGIITGVVLVFRDMTKEYKLEEQLRQSQKLEVIGQLAGGVAHDFNNALGGIIGATEILGKYLPDDPKAKKYQQMILDASTRAATLTKNLLSFSKKNAPLSSGIDVHKAIEETNSLLRKTIDKRIDIQFYPDAYNSNITGDPAHLQSAFLNICINASHAMPSGGSITITTENTEIDDVYCMLSPFPLQPGKFLQIDITDTGHGINPKDIKKIFDPFFTTKEQGEGTGIGLSSAYRVIQHHMGEINVYSELGKGARFTILLPLQKGDHKTQGTIPETVQKGSGVILVVDDEEIMRITAEAILEDLGYDILLAKDGKEAVEIYTSQQGKIDLVLLDMIMPNMNGRDCFRALQKINPEIRVVLSSGFTRSESVAEMKQEGLAGFIRKPYKMIDLSRTIFKALNKEPDNK